ncbi:MAG: CDP-2,3-bis-(O-geranylgeranyl)-sn-glycerol synthase [Candidatus Aenigmatarchaeota archaeon]
MALPEIIVALAQALWFVAPAWAANAFPPLTGGCIPLDCRIVWRGKRLLGDSKTVEGTLGGLVFGCFIGWLQMLAQPAFPPELWSDLGLFELTPVLVALIALGALAGDIIGSAAKRRIGLPPGSPFWPFDQLGFIIFAMLFASLVLALPLAALVVALVLTLFVHWFGNLLGYAMRVKKVPW